MKRAVIFDFDGTIADSLPAVVQVFEEVTGRNERFTPEQIEDLRDLSVPELMRALHVSKWKGPLLLIKGRRLLREHLSSIPLHEGMPDLLRTLHKADAPLYVLSSNSTENVQKYLQKHSLSKYFNGVYGGASLLGKAPLILRLLKNEHADPAESWYVGDEIRDVSAAHAVGLHIASVTWGYNTRMALESKQPDALADDTVELGKILEQAWKKS